VRFGDRDDILYLCGTTDGAANKEEYKV